MDALALARAVYQDPWFRAILGLLLLNVITGIAEAAYNRKLALGSMADFLLSRAFPFVLVDGVLQLVIRLALFDDATSNTGIDAALGTMVHLFVVAALVGKILQNLRDMGVPIPAVLGDRPKPPSTPSA